MVNMDLEKLSVNEQDDYIYACFQNIYAMVDWVANSTGMSKTEKAELRKPFEGNGKPYLGVIRDICNGSKHFSLNESRSLPKDLNILTQIEYDPFIKEIKPWKRVIMIPNGNDTIQNVALEGIRYWDNLIKKLS